MVWFNVWFLFCSVLGSILQPILNPKIGSKFVIFWVIFGFLFIPVLLFLGCFLGAVFGFLRLSWEAPGLKILIKPMVFLGFWKCRFLGPWSIWWSFWGHLGSCWADLIPKWVPKWIPKGLQKVVKNRSTKLSQKGSYMYKFWVWIWTNYIKKIALTERVRAVWVIKKRIVWSCFQHGLNIAKGGLRIVVKKV